MHRRSLTHPPKVVLSIGGDPQIPITQFDKATSTGPIIQQVNQQSLIIDSQIGGDGGDVTVSSMDFKSPKDGSI